MINLKEQDVEKALPTGENYDDWSVHVGQHRVWAYTLYTWYNRLVNKKYANFRISFEVANPTVLTCVSGLRKTELTTSSAMKFPYLSERLEDWNYDWPIQREVLLSFKLLFIPRVLSWDDVPKCISGVSLAKGSFSRHWIHTVESVRSEAPWSACASPTWLGWS